MPFIPIPNEVAARLAPIPFGRLTYTLDEAAAVTGLSTSTLRRRAAEGALRLVRVGGRTLVPADALHRLVGIDQPET
ncbi:MAG: excisionase family DNA-binding protein [Acetobacteraceae bacterium]|nr:excisionase family DNA-binding protein [Acetobacteraceae bacterium]